MPGIVISYIFTLDLSNIFEQDYFYFLRILTILKYTYFKDNILIEKSIFRGKGGEWMLHTQPPGDVGVLTLGEVMFNFTEYYWMFVFFQLKFF